MLHNLQNFVRENRTKEKVWERNFSLSRRLVCWRLEQSCEQTMPRKQLRTMFVENSRTLFDERWTAYSLCSTLQKLQHHVARHLFSRSNTLAQFFTETLRSDSLQTIHCKRFPAKDSLPAIHCKRFSADDTYAREKSSSGSGYITEFA